MRKLTIPLVIAALTIVPLPAHAASSKAPMQARSGKVPLNGGIAGFGSKPNSELTRIERIGQTLTRSRELGGSGMIALHEISAEAAATDTGAEYGYGTSIGDVDGDGLTDILTFESSGDTEALVGRIGTTGEQLWRVDLLPWSTTNGRFGGYTHNYTWMGLEDMNDDSVADLFLFTYSSTRNTLTSATYKTAHRVTTHDGKTGVAQWSVAGEGRFTEFRTAPAGVEHMKNTLWNGGMFADVSGDSVEDPFLQICNSKAVLIQQGRLSTEAECEAIHLSGATGEIVATTTYEGPTPAEITSVGDLDGDGLGDLVTMRPFAQWFSIVEARSADGTWLWSTDLPYFEQVWASSIEIDGSVGRDLLLHGYSWNEETDGFTVATISGPTGRTLWTRQLPWDITVAFVNDIDGDGGMDILTAKVADENVKVSAYEGALFRSRIWQRTLEIEVPPGVNAYPYLSYLGDLDGNGSLEMALGTAHSSFNEYFQSGTEALDGSTGATLWSLPNGEPVPATLWSDLDGNGTLDLYRTIDVGSGQAIEVIDGLTLGTVWVSATEEGADGDAFADPIDATDSPGLELLAWWPTSQGNLVTVEAPTGRAWGLSYNYGE